MTVHIALVGVDAAVLVSDSQGSTDATQDHGFEKQYAGDGFLLGIAGRIDVLNAVLEEVRTGATTNGGQRPSAAIVARCIEQFLESNVREQARDIMSFLLVHESAGAGGVRELDPAFRSFRGGTKFGTIGSGSEFVDRQRRALRRMGVSLPTSTLVDIVYTSLVLADVSRESLTVDDAYSVAILFAQRTYVLADARASGSNLPPGVATERAHLHKTLVEIRGAVRSIESEVATALGNIHRIAAQSADLSAVQAGAQMVGGAVVEGFKQRAALHAKIMEFLRWYDVKLGRPALP